MPKLTKRFVDAAAQPAAGDVIFWDEELKGFGLRVYSTGQKTFMIQYRAGGRTRRLVLGSAGTLTPDEARRLAREELVAVDKGQDPSRERALRRKVPTVAELCRRFLTEHVAHRCKPSTQGEYQRAVDLFIKPALGTFRVTDVSRRDIADLHTKYADKPYQANRTLGVLSVMFNLAEVWGLRPDGSNPCRHVRKYPEEKRERFLTEEEYQRLDTALTEAAGKSEPMASAVAAFRLLALTGCRLGEIQTLQWEHVRPNGLALPDSKTGAKLVPIGQDVRDLLAAISKKPDNPYVITGKVWGQYLTDLERPWRSIRKAAGLPDLRIHDLRHSFASVAASSGESLYSIGKVLGHNHSQTTQRYAHLAEAALAGVAGRTSERVAAALRKRPPGEEKSSLLAQENASESAKETATSGSAQLRHLGRLSKT